MNPCNPPAHFPVLISILNCTRQGLSKLDLDISEPHLNKILSSADKDKSGSIDFKEVHVARAAHARIVAGRAHAAICRPAGVRRAGGVRPPLRDSAPAPWRRLAARGRFPPGSASTNNGVHTRLTSKRARRARAAPETRTHTHSRTRARLALADACMRIFSKCACYMCTRSSAAAAYPKTPLGAGQ